MKNYIKLMRPKHYLKNGLIFLPLFFAVKIFYFDKLIACSLVFISFCLMASVVYIINDIKDKEKDKLHEIKKNRPIASGKVSIPNAIILAIILFCLSYALTVFATKSLISLSFIYILIYLLINILYSFGLKNIPLVDVTILVAGFLIRILCGASIADIALSNWFYLTIIFILFYMGLGKRRNEIMKSGSKSRSVLNYYSKEFLDKNMYMCLSIAIVFYSLWTVSMNNIYLPYTVVLVVMICMKYSMNIEKDNYGDPVDVIINDKILLVLVGITAITLMGIIYM